MSESRVLSAPPDIIIAGLLGSFLMSRRGRLAWDAADTRVPDLSVWSPLSPLAQLEWAEASRIR